MTEARGDTAFVPRGQGGLPAPKAAGITSSMQRSARTLRSVGSAGFTLIEILVVVFIIGLLATIVSVNVIGQTDNARITKAKADLKEIEQGLHLYKLDNGIYPTTEQGLRALVEKPTSGPQPRKYNSEAYIQKVPEDPWGNPYVYLSDGQAFVLKCLGADGEQGGEGKSADIDSRDLG